MPTVLREKGYRFFFFSNEMDEPVHIHIAKDECYAKYWLEPIMLARNYRFSSRELAEIRQYIIKNEALIREKWHEHFNQ